MSDLRLEKVRALLKRENLKALIVDNPIDLFYLTGCELSSGRLIIELSETQLFVDGRYYEACRSRLPFSVVLATSFDPQSQFGKGWKFAHEKVGFDADYTSYGEYERLSHLKGVFIPLKSPVKKIREIKEKDEIERLRQAAELGSRGYDLILTLLHEGISEKEVARELELFWIKEGADRLAFAPHIAFGEGSSQPHYHAGERRLKSGDIVLIDIGVVYRHYHSDMTRVLFFGSTSQKLCEIYSIVFEAQQAALALCRPKISIAELDKAARDVIEKAGYKEYFTHGLGHGVGLEIHELPSLRPIHPSNCLEEGMVITIEPGIYLPGIGGVRLEDTVLITQPGFDNLTQRPLSQTPLQIAQGI